MEQIFIVEDEEKIASILQKYICAEGFETTHFNHGGEVVNSVRQKSPALIILDIMLPVKNGIEICKEIRQFSTVPIIMVTAKVEEIDRLLGLELGADDYICKPFSPREVIARIKSVLRRSVIATQTPHISAQAISQHKSSLILDESNFKAQLDTCGLDLTPIEFRILTALSEKPIRIWRRSNLIERMYNDHRAVSDRTVDSHVANLRKKLQAIRPHSECIQPIYGVGYRYLE